MTRRLDMKLRQHAPAALQQLLHMRVWFEIRRQRAQRRAQPGEGGEGEACGLLPPPHSFLTYCLHQSSQSTNDESFVQCDQATIGAVNKSYNELGCCTVQQLLFLITAFRSAASMSLRSDPPTLIVRAVTVHLKCCSWHLLFCQIVCVFLGHHSKRHKHCLRQTCRASPCQEDCSQFWADSLYLPL